MRMPRLIQQVSERTTVDKADVQAVFYAAFDEIYKAMLRNESVVVKGFGTFRLDYRVPSRGYCIIKNEVVEHPEKYAPAVKFERDRD